MTMGKLCCELSVGIYLLALACKDILFRIKHAEETSSLDHSEGALCVWVSTSAERVKES